MTDDELKAIEKACAKATPPPWMRGPGDVAATGEALFGRPASVPESDKRWTLVHPTYATKADLDFIAGAREWVPALLAELRNARQEEREACAKVAEADLEEGEGRARAKDRFDGGASERAALRIAAAIRARK